MDKYDSPPTIYISSTYIDLIEYREAVHKAIRRLRNHAEDMIYWSADERSATAVSVENVRNSDLLLLVVAHRYGSTPADDVRSFTHIEYDTARQYNIPVLAFFADPAWPWPPDYIDVEASVREQLSRFKREVEANCVRQFFSTTESLAVLVTQAIANFDRRVHGLGKVTPLQERPIALVKPRTELVNRPNCLVQVREAEDGLPLLLDVRRVQVLDNALRWVANVLERGLDATPLDVVSSLLQDEGVKVWRRRGIFDVRTPSGHDCRSYVSHATLSSLFSPSLLTTVLPLPSQVIHSSEYSPEMKGTRRTSLVSRAGLDPRVQSLGGRNRFLSIGIDTDEAFAVGWENDRKPFLDSPVYWRPFISESLFGFTECQVAISAYDEMARKYEPVARVDLREFQATLTRLMEANSQPDRVRFVTKSYVTRRSVASVILLIGKRLEELHESGSIHGDVKPHNILLGRDGPVLIDSISLRLGELAPAISPGWAAPEQVLLLPVSEATDIYPLGVMLASMVGGQMTGELAQYVIPSEGGHRGRISFFKNPRIYLDPPAASLPRTSRVDWLNFIERCLRFFPEERPSTASAFVSELEDLLTTKPLEGWAQVDLERLGTPIWARLPDGTEAACRALQDDWEEFYKYSQWLDRRES